MNSLITEIKLNMKKLSFVLALLISTSFVIVSAKSNSKEIKETPYCIEIECKKDPKCENSCEWYKFKEVIYANGGAHARQIAENKHPGCRIGAPIEGTCK